MSPAIRLTRRRFSRSDWANERSGRSPLQGWSANTSRRTACVHYGILMVPCISPQGKFSSSRTNDGTQTTALHRESWPALPGGARVRRCATRVTPDQWPHRHRIIGSGGRRERPDHNRSALAQRLPSPICCPDSASSCARLRADGGIFRVCAYPQRSDPTPGFWRWRRDVAVSALGAAVLDGGPTSGETLARVLVPRLTPGRQEGMR